MMLFLKNICFLLFILCNFAYFCLKLLKFKISMLMLRISGPGGLEGPGGHYTSFGALPVQTRVVGTELGPKD